jgi:multiple sugar transport system permease protein
MSIRKNKFIKKLISKKVASTILLFIWLIASLLPLVFMAITSFKSHKEAVTLPVTWIPFLEFIPKLDAYYEVLFGARPFALYIRNTIIVAVAATVATVALSAIAGYAFSRFSFKFKEQSMLLVLGARLFPPITILVPWYMMASLYRMINTLEILIITNIYMSLPFTTWLLKGFYDGIPRDLDDSALVDGCSHFAAFRKIIFPLITPGAAAAAIITFLWTWNEFVFATILTQTEAARVVSAGVFDFIADEVIEWPKLMASAFLACVPAIIVVMIFQKFIVKGLAMQAIKA